MEELDPLIHQATRLRVMTLLFRNRDVAFTWAQEALGLTPGNLDSHVGKLVEAGYVQQGRALTARGFQSRLRITPAGDEAYRRYLRALRATLEGAAGAGEPEGGAGASAAQKSEPGL